MTDKKHKKPDPFNSPALGEFKPDKKHPNKNVYAWSRSAEIEIPEAYAQEWIDPVTFKKRLVYGKVKLVELKLANKDNGEIGFSRIIEPLLHGGQVKDIIP